MDSAIVKNCQFWKKKFIAGLLIVAIYRGNIVGEDGSERIQSTNLRVNFTILPVNFAMIYHHGEYEILGFNCSCLLIRSNEKFR